MPDLRCAAYEQHAPPFDTTDGLQVVLSYLFMFYSFTKHCNPFFHGSESLIAGLDLGARAGALEPERRWRLAIVS